MNEQNISIKDRNVVLSFFIWQCIVSVFCILITNIFEEINEYSYPEMWVWCFIKNIIILFVFVFLYKSHIFTQGIRKNLLILSIFMILDFIIYNYCYTNESFGLCTFLFFSLNYLPYLMLNISIKVNQYIVAKYAVDTLMLKYILILVCLFFVNILIPIIIFSYTLTFAMIAWLFWGVAFIVIFSKLIPIVALVSGIMLERQEYYVKHIAPKLKYILFLGIPIDIMLFVIKPDCFSLKHFAAPFSFTLTFFPLYVVYLCHRLYKYFRK